LASIFKAYRNYVIVIIGSIPIRGGCIMREVVNPIICSTTKKSEKEFHMNKLKSSN